MSKASIEMHLTLAGPRADVSALLLLAAEQGLLKAMDVVESSDNGAATKAQAPSLSRPFNPGARVQVRWDSTFYGLKAGDRGAVVTCVKYKRGYRVTVRWDSAFGGGESTVGSSSLVAA